MYHLDKVRLCDIKQICESNGVLGFADLPFYSSRIFYVYGVRVGDTRGKHAHKLCEQFLICIRGSVSVMCDDGTDRRIFKLDTPLKGLYIPKMIWTEQYYYDSSTILLAMASHHFDESDYIRDYAKFKEAV